MNQPPDGSPPPGRPLFLQPDAETPYVQLTGDELPDFTASDEAEPLPAEYSALKPRHREIARLHALGHTNNAICAKLGYSTSRVSILLGTPALKAEVDRYRNRLYDQDLITAMKDLGPDAIGVVQEMIRDPNQKLKDRTVEAKWLLEKLTGKAKQEVSVENNSLAAFTELLKNMQRAGEVIDVTDSSGSEVRGAEGAGQPNGSDAPQQARLVGESPKRTESKYSGWVDSEIE